MLTPYRGSTVQVTLNQYVVQDIPHIFNYIRGKLPSNPAELLFKIKIKYRGYISVEAQRSLTQK